MDSGDSGSLHSSSSGGDGGGIAGEVNNSTHLNHTPILQPPSSFFDPLSFSQPLNKNPNLYNLDSLWSRTSNSNPNSIYDLDSRPDQYLNPNPVDSGPEKLGVTNKNPKKRTRASRRAPTTVLTTDTTNFRKMVQEFTGIPAGPFSGSSPSSVFSRRSDFHGAGISPVHPLRPSAQKFPVQQPSYLNSGASASNFHLTLSETHGFTKQPLNFSNLQNQMFPFQSLLQTNLHQQVNVSVRESQRSESSSTTLKRWRGQDENLVNFEGVDGNMPNAVVSSRSDEDQLPEFQVTRIHGPDD